MSQAARAQLHQCFTDGCTTVVFHSFPAVAKHCMFWNKKNLMSILRCLERNQPLHTKWLENCVHAATSYRSLKAPPTQGLCVLVIFTPVSARRH